MRLFIGLVAFSLVLIAGAAGFVYSGIYDTSATDQHSAPVFWLLKTVMRRAVHHHARAIHVPRSQNQRASPPDAFSIRRIAFAVTAHPVSRASRSHSA